MRRVFADTFYWVATIAIHDQWHYATQQAKAALGDVHLITTEEVLTEFLTTFGGYGSFLRRQAAATVRLLLIEESITVIPQTHLSFLHGLELYESRADKEYSLTHCISMNTMRNEGILEALTNDHHFSQEGFTILIKSP